jgi:hypothetical protein
MAQALTSLAPERRPVCAATSVAHDVVDFNKSCEELRGAFLPLSGTPVYYFRCDTCGFCHSPEFRRWSLAQFSERIYNDEYARVDPDYLDVRPRGNAAHLAALLGDQAIGVRHLDYGGGNGLLSSVLQDAGWDSQTYDPFVDRDVALASLGRFDLVTAYEVFEHVPDVEVLIDTLSSLVSEDGVVLFSTLISDGSIAPRQRLTWWYASPRNGHISLFSRDSLARLGARQRFKFGSFTPNLHVFWRSVPEWAAHFLHEPAPA